MPCTNPTCPCRQHFLTIREAAVVLRRAPRTLYRWIQSGDLRAKWVKDHYLIEGHELFKLLHEDGAERGALP